MVTVLEACKPAVAVYTHSRLMQQRHHSRQALIIAPPKVKSGEGLLPGVHCIFVWRCSACSLGY